MHLCPKTSNTPHFHAEHCRVCQQKCRVYRNCPCFGRSIVTFSKPEAVGIKQAQSEGCNQKPYLSSPTSKPPKERCPTYLPFCFSSVSFSQQFGNKTNYCDLSGDDPDFFLMSRNTKKVLQPEENILKIFLKGRSIIVNLRHHPVQAAEPQKHTHSRPGEHMHTLIAKILYSLILNSSLHI